MLLILFPFGAGIVVGQVVALWPVSPNMPDMFVLLNIFTFVINYADGENISQRTVRPYRFLPKLVPGSTTISPTRSR